MNRWAKSITFLFMKNKTQISDYKKSHPHSGTLQVPHPPEGLVRRLRQHCKENGVFISFFVVKAVEAALNAAQAAQVKGGK
jgi:hypothetical protein